MKFTLDAAALERVFSLWNIPLPKAGLVLFALRGCVPQPTPPRSLPRRGGRKGGVVKSINLNVVPLDFAHMRCTIGIWDRKSGRIFAAPGSTVPHRDNVLKAAARPGAMRG